MRNVLCIILTHFSLISHAYFHLCDLEYSGASIIKTPLGNNMNSGVLSFVERLSSEVQNVLELQGNQLFPL